MFELLQIQSEIDKLQTNYARLIKEAYSVSTSNRKLFDKKTFEAIEILHEIDRLNKFIFN